MFPSQLANKFLTYQTFVTNLHPLRVGLRCKLQEKLHRVTGPLRSSSISLQYSVQITLITVIAINKPSLYRLQQANQLKCT